MEIALCLSGGGYRASLYHLGVLTFLDELKCSDGSALLDHVHSFSCISGGALTGLKYVLSVANGYGRKETFKTIYKEIIETNVGELLIEQYSVDAKKGKALIQSLSKIYDDRFFHGEKFEKIIDYMDWNGIHHFFADATDFDIGLPFRFQATALLSSPTRKTPYGMIGNWRHSINRDEAKKIKLADILASTSCFPLVFEPIMYPTEFCFEGENVNRDGNLLVYPLMDGGLIDNQGVEPAYHISSHLKDEGKEFDFAIISDAGILHNQMMNKKWKLWNILNVSPQIIYRCLFGFFIFFLFCSVISMLMEYLFASGCFIMMAIACIVHAGSLRLIDSYLIKKIEVCSGIKLKKDPIWSNSLKSIGMFVKARCISAYRMADVIMSGNQKRLWFRALHNDPIWKNRIMMNSLSVFSTAKTWKKIIERQHLAKKFSPTDNMLKSAKIAANTETALWFNEDQINEGVPQAIFACGRYTTCWNLLVHIEKLKQINSSELTPFQARLIAEENNIREFWIKFCSNHFYQLKRYTS